MLLPHSSKASPRPKMVFSGTPCACASCCRASTARMTSSGVACNSKVTGAWQDKFSTAARVIALEQRQIPIQLGGILEYRDARQHFYDLEDHFNLGRHVHKRGLPAPLLKRFAGHGENPDPGAAEKPQL